MLHLEKIRKEHTVQIKVQNRLFYLLALDGLSVEESNRLWRELASYISGILNTDDNPFPDYVWLIHYLWWERQKVAVIFITGDVLDRLEEMGKGVQELLDAVSQFEENEIHIPFCSMNSTDGELEKSEDRVTSRVSMTTNEETGEVVVNATVEDICYAAFRR